MFNLPKLRLMLIALLFVLSLGLPTAVVAQGDIQVLRNEHTYVFRDHITFRLEARSAAEISAITLSVRVSGESGRQRDEPEFTPGQAVSVEVVWDEMAEDTYRPPGVEIRFWWDIEDAAGHTLRTEPITFVYMDDQHPWRVLENEQVALYWYAGDDSLGSSLFERAVQAVDQIAAELGVEVEDQVKIFIYGTYDALRASLGEGSHEWVGGISFTDYAIIAIGVEPGNISYGLRVIPHELSHAVIAQMMEPPFGKLPHWMDEGLAVHYEGSLTGDEQSALAMAIKNNTLLSIRSLASNFPEDSRLATLAYAQSNSVIEYILKVYGNQTMAQLLEVFAVGAHQDDGFMQVLGIDVDGLEDEWRAYIGAPPREGATRATPLPSPTPLAGLASPSATPSTTVAPTPQPAAAATATVAPTPTPVTESGGTGCASPLAGLILVGLALIGWPRNRG
ncbi:MAG: peptidase MA family metallohydrolase [Chloroflexota bacterium]